MIANNIAAFSNTAGRFHRNSLAMPQLADCDDLNPYTMMTRSQARRKSGKGQLIESPPAINAAAKRNKPFFIMNQAPLRSRNFQCCVDMKQETTRDVNNGTSTVWTPTIIKSNPVFQCTATNENVSELVSGKTKSREEEMKQAIIELAQLGEHYMASKKRGAKPKNKRTDGPLTKVPNLRALHKKTKTRHSDMTTVKSPLSTKDVNSYIKRMNAVDVHY